jgi:hypothetical protein
MLVIANKYTLFEEVTLDNREAKEDKKLSQSDQPDISKSNNKKRKHDRFVANVERSRHNRTKYRPWPREFEGLLYEMCIFHPQGKHKTRGCNRLQGFADEVGRKG